jgi:hypothetical protein
LIEKLKPFLSYDLVKNKPADKSLKSMVVVCADAT